MRLFIGTPAARLHPICWARLLWRGDFAPVSGLRSDDRVRPVRPCQASCLTASTDRRTRDRDEYSRRVQPEVPPRGAQAAEGWLRRTRTTPRQCAVALARGGTT